MTFIQFIGFMILEGALLLAGFVIGANWARRRFLNYNRTTPLYVSTRFVKEK